MGCLKIGIALGSSGGCFGVSDRLQKSGGIFTGITNFEMTIWNCYGERVFLTNDIDEGWNRRRFNAGKLLEQGVYLYLSGEI